MKRRVVPIFDFDTRASLLAIDVDAITDERAAQLMRQNQAQLLAHLKAEFGAQHFDERLANFKALGPSPLSIISHHNDFFRQIRSAFVYASYYPALTGACSLGERILNHLVLDLRDNFKGHPDYKRVYRKASFDDWTLAIETLTAWGVIDDKVKGEFGRLHKLRNRSIHFDAATYASAREDALAAIKHLHDIIQDQFAAIKHLHDIIQDQFAAFGPCRWFIKGTRGVCFIAKAYETNPFVKAYYLPQCPPVSPYYSVGNHAEGRIYFDRKELPALEVTDDQFCALYEQRKPEEVVPNTLPVGPNIETYVFKFG